MSLVVWLPLNGDLENQGLSNVTVTNNGATVDNNGKIGKCYNFNGSNSIATSFNSSAFTNNTFSLSIWFNITTLRSDYDSLCCLYKGSGGSWYDTPIWLGRWSSSNNWGVAINNASTGPISCLINTALNLNTWYHMAVTYDGVQLKIYLNGNLENTTASNLQIGYSYATQFAIGTAWGGYKFQGKINDIRIYNHALSAKEVKDLAKGLVLHYRLAGPGQPNLAKNTFGTEEKGYTVPSSGGSEGGPRYAVSGIEGGKTYTVSAYIKGSANMNLYTLNSGGDVAYTWVNKSNMSTDYKFYSLTFTMATGRGTTNEIYICTRYTQTPTPGDWFKILPNSVKIEEGSVATPWCPNPADSLYSTLGYDNNIEYDCSGYEYNGTQNKNFIWSADSPRYTTSYLKTSNSKPLINIPTVFPSGASIPEITMACWWKSDSTTSTDRKNLISLGANNFIRFGPISSTKEWIYCTGTVAEITIPNCMDMKWHHHVITFKGGVFSVYFDGELKGTQTTSLSSIDCSSTTNYIGAYASNNEIVPGAFSDARIYATALPAEDIAELYHSAVIVDNTGKNYAYEYFEA